MLMSRLSSQSQSTLVLFIFVIIITTMATPPPRRERSHWLVLQSQSNSTLYSSSPMMPRTEWAGLISQLPLIVTDQGRSLTLRLRSGWRGKMRTCGDCELKDRSAF